MKFVCLLFLLLHTRCGIATYDCIEHCTCVKRQNVVTADCIASNFTEVPFPNPPSQVNFLYLQFNFISIIRDDDFAMFEHLRLLNMSGNRLTAIENSAFTGLSSLETLDLSANLLTSIPEGSWVFIKNRLTWLSLAANAFFKIPNAVSNMSRLTHLDVSSQFRITDITSVRLPASLQTLDLSFMPIKDFKKSSFEHLRSLTTLILTDNRAGSSVKFETGLFDELESLEYLDLSRMFCRHLPRDSFRRLRKLKSLSLNNCYMNVSPLMAEIVEPVQGDNGMTDTTPAPSTTLWFNPKLEHLDLSDNRRLVLEADEKHFSSSLIEVRLDYTNIQAIDDSIFNESESIQTLNLSHARLESISTKAFDYLQNLTELDLSDNQLGQFPQLPQTLKLANLKGSRVTNITRDLLESMHDITELSCANGDIMTVEDYAFRNLIKMEHLDLSDNKIQSLTKHTLAINGANNANRLRTLDMSANILSYIEDEAFISLGQLKVLDLQVNSLSAIEQRTFVGLTNIVTLNLNSNSIKVLDPNALDHLITVEFLNLDDNELEMINDGTFSSVGHLKKLILSNNKLVMVRPMELQRLQYLDISHNNLTSFPVISGNLLETVLASHNPLTDFEPGAFQQTHRLKELDLSQCSFMNVNYSVFREIDSLETLDLHGNMITNFVDCRLGNLKKLLLSSNHISAISTLLHTILPNLQELHMKYNTIKNLNPSVFYNVSFVYLDLAVNQFRCDCDTIPFARWMSNHKSFLVGWDHWLCMSPKEVEHQPILEVVESLNCARKQAATPSIMLIVIAAAVACLLIVISIYVIRACVKSRRTESSPEDRGEGYVVEVASASRCSLLNCCKGGYEDQRNLVSTVSSPSQKDAPTSL